MPGTQTKRIQTCNCNVVKDNKEFGSYEEQKNLNQPLSSSPLTQIPTEINKISITNRSY